MLTINDLGKRLPYTYKEIVEINYPEFWDASTECIKRLDIWQQMIVDSLASWKTIVNSHSKERYSENAKITLLNYLKLRSIYGLAVFIWKDVNRLCHELGVSSNNNNQDGINQAKAALISLFDAFDNVDIFGIAQDDTAGFEKLEQVVASFETRAYIQVMDSWSFSDILITIKNGRLGDLWESTIKDIIPIAPNVGGLMESAEDNEIVRIY